MREIISSFESTYELKEPWRLTNKSLAIVVPIVLPEGKSAPREYVVLEEVKNKVRIRDTGSIDRATIRANVGKSVFVRGGTMLKGKTQERVTQYSTVIAPRKTEKLEILCIHASKGIRSGASFISAGLIPLSLHDKGLSARNQGVAWRAFSGYHDSVCRFELRNVPRDDLLRTVKTVERFSKDLKEILKNIPNYINQVGTVILDVDGVVGFEMYDHPDSWSAFAESITRSFAEVLAREDKAEIFKPDMKRIKPLILSFIKELENLKEEEVFNQNDAKTKIVKNKGYVGECTTLSGKTIHLLITRREKDEPRPQKEERDLDVYPDYRFTEEESDHSSPTPFTDWVKKQKK